MVMHQEIINKDEMKVSDDNSKLKSDVELLKKAQVSLIQEANKGGH